MLAAFCVASTATQCQERLPDLLIYNRVGRTGGTSMKRLLAKLAKRNNFTVIDGSYGLQLYDHKAVVAAALTSLDKGRRSVLVSHFFYPEPSELSTYGDRIAYINVVREPVARCKSQYRFERDADRRPAHAREPFVAMYGNTGLDECVEGSRRLPRKSTCSSCSLRDPGHLLHDGNTTLSHCLTCGPSLADYLCGNELDACQRQPRAAQAGQAWANVRDHYVVGITEALQETAELFEVLFPTYFGGAGVLMAKQQHALSTGLGAAAASTEAEAKLKELLQYDIKLYQAIEGTFWRAHQACVRPKHRRKSQHVQRVQDVSGGREEDRT